jgi:hypothetical protein
MNFLFLVFLLSTWLPFLGLESVRRVHLPPQLLDSRLYGKQRNVPVLQVRGEETCKAFIPEAHWHLSVVEVSWEIHSF